MRIDDCFELGYIVKTHGLAGQLTIQMDVDDPSQYYEMESVFLEQSGRLVPFFFEAIIPQGTKLIAKFEEIDTADLASNLTGCRLFLPTDLLPSLDQDSYYLHDLIGMDVIYKDETLGKIETIYQPSAQYLASVNYLSHEVLIPIEDDIIIEVDKEASKVFVNLPDGFLAVYTSES